jgi:hypothetical protein
VPYPCDVTVWDSRLVTDTWLPEYVEYLVYSPAHDRLCVVPAREMLPPASALSTIRNNLPDGPREVSLAEAFIQEVELVDDVQSPCQLDEDGTRYYAALKGQKIRGEVYWNLREQGFETVWVR